MSNESEMSRLRHKILTMLTFEERTYIQPLLDKCLMFATEESNPQGDLISRSALKKYKFTTQHANGVELEDIEVVPVAAIDNAEAVVNVYTKGFADGERSGRNFSLADEEKAMLVRQWRPRGEWIIDGHHYKCSLCGKTLAIMFSETDDDLIGCPFCLADMRGGRE